MDLLLNTSKYALFFIPITYDVEAIPNHFMVLFAIYTLYYNLDISKKGGDHDFYLNQKTLDTTFNECLICFSYCQFDKAICHIQKFNQYP